MATPLSLYQRYTQTEILAAFQSNAPPGLGWARAGSRLLGFFQVGRIAPDIHFCNARQFHWYGPVAAGVPEDLQAFSKLDGAHLFIRCEDGAYVYAADIRHVGMYGGGPPRCEATMDLEPAVPTEVLAEVGGLYVHPEGDLAMDVAVASLRDATTPAQRFRALKSFVEFWRGPVDPSQALGPAELAKARVPIPPLLQDVYLWAGGCDDVMSAGYFSLVPPHKLKIYDEAFVAVCTECQWCGNYFVRRDALETPDPEVFVDDCGDSHAGTAYTALGIGLSQFLWVYYVGFNLTKGPLSGAIEISESEKERLFDVYRPLPLLGPTAAQALRAIDPCGSDSMGSADLPVLFARGGVMGSVVAGSRGPVVSLAAKADSAVAAFLSRLGIDPSRVEELL